MKAKTSFGFMAIWLFIAGNVYASHAIDDKSRPGYIQKSENKKKPKISERKILKKAKVEEEQVSNFSMEELRVGAQRIPDKSEVLYSKSQCRYAFMSDRDVIENRCEVKKIIPAK